MFKKMRKRIFNSVFYVVLAFVVLISGVSFFVTANNLQRSQQQRAQSNAESGVKGVETYLSAVMGFVEQTAKQKGIVDAVSGVDITGASRALDSLCGYAVKIDGAILYGANGYVAYSSGVGSPPSFSELMSVQGVAEFYGGQGESCVSMRKQAVAHMYNRVFYNSSNGVVSVMRKVYGENGNVLGLLVADVMPETLCSVKLVYKSFGVQCNAFIASGELLSDNKTFGDYYNSSKNGTTSDGKYYVASAEMANGEKVVMFTSLNDFTNNLALMAGILVAIDVILVSFGALFASYVASSVVNPLDDLLKRMVAGA